MLDELEASTKDTLVAPEEKAALLTRLPRLGFCMRHFRSEWNTTANNTEAFGIVVQITTGVSLAKVCGKWTANLSFLVIGEGVIKVVVTLGIGT